MLYPLSYRPKASRIAEGTGFSRGNGGAENDMPNIPLMGKPPSGAESAGASDKKPDKMNLARMVKVLGILVVTMSAAAGLCCGI